MQRTGTDPEHRVLRELKFFLVLIALAILFWLPRLNGLIDLRWDSSVYYSLGTSLAQGNGYRLSYEPGEIRAVQYPPLLPAVIAIHQLILRTDDPLIVGRWLRLSWFFFFTIYLCLVYLMAKDSIPRIYALFVAVLCLLSPRVVFMSDICFPEILFSITAILAFICSRKISRWISEIGGFLFVSCSYLLRTIGMALAAAWIFESILKKSLKTSIIRIVLISIPIVLWLGYVRMVEESLEYKNPEYLYQRTNYLYYNVSYPRNIFSYKDPFMPELGVATAGDLVFRFGQNLKHVPIALSETVNWDRRSWERFRARLDSFGGFRLAWPVAYVLLLLPGWLMLCGVIFQLTKREFFSAAYILFSIVLICSAPWPMQIVRYLTPLIPFLLLACIQLALAGSNFFKSLSNRRLKSIGTVLPAAVILLLLMQEIPLVANMYIKHYNPVVYQIGHEKKTVARWFYYDEFYQALDQGLDWLKSRVKPEDVIASSTPPYVFLRTGNKAVMPPFVVNDEEAQRLLDSVPVKYLIIDGTESPVSRRYGSRPVLRFPQFWKEIYSNPAGGLQIYERQP